MKIMSAVQNDARKEIKKKNKFERKKFIFSLFPFDRRCYHIFISPQDNRILVIPPILNESFSSQRP